MNSELSKQLKQYWYTLKQIEIAERGSDSAIFLCSMTMAVISMWYSLDIYSLLTNQVALMRNIGLFATNLLTMCAKCHGFDQVEKIETRTLQRRQAIERKVHQMIPFLSHRVGRVALCSFSSFVMWNCSQWISLSALISFCCLGCCTIIARSELSRSTIKLNSMEDNFINQKLVE